ncbi:unnamed protein product [Blepharisma stoltei]|uniref:Uncharacterized protein n=1 Tax=Blepharisma stoltei TaxID=1481888 RepID=A0AAU9IZ05_9CILI|nr:unnamed protein product [Blepharisma stoltei]
MSSIRWVTSGPQFWVTKLLQKQGIGMSTNGIWKAAEEEKIQDLIPSKNFLKRKVIARMYGAGCIYKAKAEDLQAKRLTRDGWKLNPVKAFKFIHPDLRGDIKLE